MGIVRFALKFPHTFYVVAALVLFLGVVASIKMPTDIFPEINIPVVTVVWSYTGLSTPEMEQRVTTYSQYAISSNVSGIKNIEAQTMAGLSVQKIYFQPDVNLDLAIAQIVSATNAIRALLPPGIQAPLVVQFNASSVPVLQISLSSDTLNEQELYDYGISQIRQQLAPNSRYYAAGALWRQRSPDHGRSGPAGLLAKGITPMDVVDAVNAKNPTLPAGAAKSAAAIPCQPEQHAGDRRRLQQHSDQGREWRDHLHEGRRPGSRRLADADNVVRRDGSARAAHHPQERQRLHADLRQRGPRPCRRRAPRRRRVSRSRSCSTSRCSFKRRWRRPARGHDRGRSDRADDPAVPGIVANDPDRDDLDSAVDPDVDRSAVFPRRDAQRDDAGRAGAGGRHPGRRRHRRDREHPSPSPRKASRCRRPRCTARRGAPMPTLVSTLAISCVFTSVIFLEGPENICSPRLACRGVCHAGVLRIVANAHAHHHRSVAERRTAWPGRECMPMSGWFSWISALSCRVSATASRRMRQGLRQASSPHCSSIVSSFRAWRP